MGFGYQQSEKRSVRKCFLGLRFTPHKRSAAVPRSTRGIYRAEEQFLSSSQRSKATQADLMRLSAVAHPQERKGPPTKNGSHTASAGTVCGSASHFIQQESAPLFQVPLKPPALGSGSVGYLTTSHRMSSSLGIRAAYKPRPPFMVTITPNNTTTTGEVFPQQRSCRSRVCPVGDRAGRRCSVPPWGPDALELTH